MTFLVYTAAIITSGLRRVLYYPCLKISVLCFGDALLIDLSG